MNQQNAARFEVILMAAAIVGAVAHAIGTFIEIGRAAGWWL